MRTSAPISSASVRSGARSRSSSAAVIASASGREPPRDVVPGGIEPELDLSKRAEGDHEAELAVRAEEPPDHAADANPSPRCGVIARTGDSEIARASESNSLRGGDGRRPARA